MGIKIREKKLSSGKKSLYLDIHHNGERSYEFLKIYLTGDEKDKEKRRKAEIIRGRRLEQIQNQTYGLKTDNKEASFYQFFQKIVDKNKEKGIRNHEAVMKKIKEYHGRETLQFKQITKRWVWGFRDFLVEDSKKKNTAHNYFTIFKAAINSAIKRDIISHNPIKGVDNIGSEDTLRNFLTTDELKKLWNTPCKKRVKEAFFFACNTGLRISDVKRIQWGDVKDDKISFPQKKTTKVNHVPLNRQAKELMGERGNPNEYVFNIQRRGNVWKVVNKWGKRANLDKEISFHVSRHTFATQLLSNGADIYTVAELLGVDLKTAEVYAKIVDQKKEDAVNRLPEINF
ncbi:Site-specific recombinase XerD [Fodinibius roseus]|uniref:Site-specific recombinase XerD n=1 Tax=Fodinibius roseus TaxID=1194090 RepID=A0A1M5C6W5_9BACT|nr:site-specific integrase [Fodinibius roseus]SHF50514.1 Site-specific recombinase XerD [Fodinibius roseus]